MILLQNISKTYQTEDMVAAVLKGINLYVEKGEFVALMGPSGSGKTTLLNSLGLIDTPSQGKYFFDGEDVTSLSAKKKTLIRRNQIGFVFQSFNLIDELNIYENIELPLIYSGVKGAERKEVVETILERMKIGHRRKFFPHQLSGGQQQRAAIARAVVNNPSLILADEPTGNLDSKNGTEVMDLLRELNSTGTTLIMVTHSKHFAGFANRIVNLFDGKILSDNVTQAFS
ncbi:MAG: ABC transporter ATP-binding protein [Bacteroidales bacterium]|nr:ABC transporter ATP-binding protein [Bacteroidales bacterium]